MDNSRRISQYYLYRMVHKDWYESLDKYQPSDELFHVVIPMVPSTWKTKRNNVWFRVSPPGISLPQQGWKIHISATPSNCEEILRKVSEICIERNVTYKFLLDQHLVSLTGGKGWTREASGKFITIYPLNEEHFRELIEALYIALQGYQGPYILTDRRYKDSHVIYYRYGAIRALYNLTLSGDRLYLLTTPDQKPYPDYRMPYFSPPPWVSDPFPPEDHEGDPLLKEGRYQIESALNFSVTGGVYLAQDLHTGKKVIIKEARPFTQVDANGHDATDRLKKEYELLEKLSPLGICPQPIDLFWDWEHLFLVEEYIDGPDLARFMISSGPLVEIHPKENVKQAYAKKLHKIWTSLSQGLASMHDQNIVCGDLSIKNVLLSNEDRGEVRIIDLEAAMEIGVHPPTQIKTPGYTSPSRGQIHTKEDDIYSLGAVMLGTMFLINTFIDLQPSSQSLFIDSIGADLGIPKNLLQIVKKCMSEDPGKRPTAHQVVTMLTQTDPDFDQKPSLPPMIERQEMIEIINNVTNYIRKNADPLRQDRLFPADLTVYYTNPLSVANGALGVAYALNKIDGEIPSKIKAWLLTQSVDHNSYPPGLYIGLAGISWALWEIGMEDLALKTMRSIENHPLLWQQADLYYGMAGYGMSTLHFYLNTKDEHWLNQATQVGDWLLQTKKENENGHCYWPDTGGNAWLGLSQGSSGVALFLLYLSIATKEEKYLELGKSALAFDLSHIYTEKDGYFTMPRGKAGSSEENVLSHYWQDGSAGVATVLLRYGSYTKDPEYLKTFEKLARDSFRKYTVFPGLFRGLSGLGNFLLDAYDFTGDEKYLKEAKRVASGVLPYQIQRPEGIAFPGEQLLRISTDFATGSSGIALFLNRLAHADQKLGNFNFTLDQLL
ncbi:class III lanthionine synthetase LanKC [Hazenella coriacea]|uniref:Serine/threonine protein kinase n=1 Tax=Hazenella coriacea TaxID=1179467 RepID=A0A4R3L9F5_9BACL|nr:class III lanthionine synthetase LanKC [Hazenella coriacea]TCS96453.1 serine/threonine protein kinase [Hazenella coriacea]